MDLRNPVHALIPTLEGPVFMELAATSAPLTLADLHRRIASASKSGIRQALGRMVDQGVVDIVPGGYVVNREHIAFAAVEAMTDLRSVLATRVRGLLLELDPDVIAVGFFGSYARRDGDTSSDIDILVVSNAKVLDDIAGVLAQRVHQWTGNDCHVVALNSRELRRAVKNGEPIVAEWYRELDLVLGSLALFGLNR